MSEVVFLQGDRSSMASLLNKCEQGASMASSIQSASYGLSWSAGADGYYGGFCEDAVSMAKEAAVLFEKAYLTLSKCEPYWETVPDNLRKIDAKKKGDKSNWIEREAYLAENSARWFVSGTIGMLSGLFTGKNKTGEVVYLGPYLYLRDRYEWSNTNATEDEIRQAIEEGAKDERNIGIERSIDEKLRELYETKKRYFAPEKSIHEHRDGVERGTIRYCNQDLATAADNGWEGDYISKAYCTWHCNQAAESMALSYLGIDQKPGYVPNEVEFAEGVVDGTEYIFPTVDGEKTTVTANVKYMKGAFDRSYLDNKVENFTIDNGHGNYSPVMLHYDRIDYNGNYHSHWIVLIGKNDDGSYQAIGPSGASGERTVFRVKIDDNGVVSGEGFAGSGEGRTVAHVGQYSRPD